MNTSTWLWDIAYICDGQLAAMWVEAANKRWLHPVVFGTSNTASAAQAILQYWWTSIVSSEWTDMNKMYTNTLKLDQFVAALKSWAPIAFDWENAPVEALKYLETQWLILKPSWEILQTTQDRCKEKEAINRIHWETVTAEYEEVTSSEEAQNAFRQLWAGRLKTCVWWYDGKWQWKVRTEADIEDIFNKLWDNVPRMVYEKNVDFAKEISVIVGRNREWQFWWYDPFENHHEWWILRTTRTWNICINEEVSNAMIDFTKRTAEQLWVEWTMCMEMFLKKDWTFRANEIAARAHNSWHITQSTHDINQFDLQNIAMLNEPMPWHIQHKRAWKMVNIIWKDIQRYCWIDFWKWGAINFARDRVKRKTRKLVSYGKWESKPWRKMGHIEIIYW